MTLLKRSGTNNANGITLNEQKRPIWAMTILLVIVTGCLLAGLISPYDVSDMDPSALMQAPSLSHLFGTDTLGRDLFSMIWYGGRLSIYIGLFASLISTVIAVLYGAAAGLAGERVSDVMMRFTEILMSVPQILLLIFLQAMWGKATPTSIAVIIGITGWMNISKIVRSEVRQIGESDYVLAARTFGGGFLYIVRKHLLPNLVSAMMFMVVSNISAAIATEATLSFLGLGLPLTTVSWGSLMSMSQEVLLSGKWWLVLIPGIFLVVTIVCITDIGEYIRRKNNRLYSNL